MSKKLFVGSLPFKTSESDLETLFREFGEVVSVKVIRDMDTGRSKGFGFIEMENEDDAQKAIDSLNGHELEGRTIKVNVATDKPRGSRDRDHFRRKRY